MATPSSSQEGHHKSGSKSRRHRLYPVATSSGRSTSTMAGSGHNLNLTSGGAGSTHPNIKSSDSSSIEALQSPPNLEMHPGLIYTYNESSSSRFTNQRFDSTLVGLKEETAVQDYDRLYLPESLSPQGVGVQPLVNRSPVVQSSRSIGSPLSHFHSMQSNRPSSHSGFYGMPVDSGSSERFEDDLQTLITSASDTPPFQYARSFDQGGSPKTDGKTFQSDSEAQAEQSNQGSPTQKTGYRKEIEAKSRNKIRLAAQRLRNIIAPAMRPGVSLRGAADVMEEAADQIRRLSDRLRETEAEVASLRSQLEVNRAHFYDPTRLHY